MTHDLLIRNGRVIDPETGFDEVCDVALTGATIAAVGHDLGPAAQEIDATGLVVSPGFIDIHAHGQSVAADRMQAFDGVTTSLELEVGALPVAEWYDTMEDVPRVLHYGTAAAWGFARRAAFGGFTPDGTRNPIEHMGGSNDTRWMSDTATPAQTETILSLTRQALEDGAIGIGMPNGYITGAGIKELTLVCDLAKEYERPTYTHIAYMGNIDPKSSVESYVKLIGLAGATGAHMHICHLNSTSLMDIDRAVEVISKAQSQGLPITTEAYPYGAGSTVVGATFFKDPEFRERTGSDYSNIELVKNHYRFKDREDILQAGQENPADLVMWHYLDVEVNDEHRRMLDASVTYPGASIASDAMPWVRPDGTIYSGMDWPLPPEVSARPRSSGTFTRFLREYTREREVMPLVEALAKCTIYPASVVEGCAPQIARKGRLREGFDADIVIFDAATITDRATFTDMNRASEGVRHLIVAGTPVIADGVLDTGAAPGQPIRCPTAMSVPILLVTGFLGAGKTTFINGLLQDAGGLRIAAIVNDFGSINIDEALLESASDEVIGLKNGCICCSLQGDLLRTLRQVLAQGSPDLIVIEASGVADPQGIVQGLMDPVLWQAAALDSIICVVDAEDLAETPARWKDELWLAQLSAADIVQLSKVGPVGAEALALRLRAMGKRAIFGMDGTARSARDLIGAVAPGPRGTLRAPIDSTRFATLEWRSDGPVPMQLFQQVVGALSPNLLRAKGFMRFHEKPGQSFVFQMVGQRATLAPHDRAATGCELVLIGERDRFDPAAAAEALDALAAPAL